MNSFRESPEEGMERNKRIEKLNKIIDDYCEVVLEEIRQRKNEQKD